MDATSAVGQTYLPVRSGVATGRRRSVRVSARPAAWMLSLGIHALLVSVLSFCYFKDFSVVARIDDSIVTSVQFHSAEIETTPLEEPREEPVPPLMIETLHAQSEAEPLPAPELPEVTLESALPVDFDALKPEREHLSEATQATHFAEMKFKKPPPAVLQPATSPDAGGSHAGSGAAPALIAIPTASPNAIPVANGVNGSGPGSGTGRGSGEGTHPGNGTPAGDGKGYGTGHGDGIGSGSGPGREGIAVDRPPRVDRLERPDYPKDALRSGIEGTVKCLVQVLASGKVGDVRVYQSSGHADLDRAACEALKRSRFFPAEYNGRAVTFELIVPYAYRIQR